MWCTVKAKVLSSCSEDDRPKVNGWLARDVGHYHDHEIDLDLMLSNFYATHLDMYYLCP